MSGMQQNFEGKMMSKNFDPGSSVQRAVLTVELSLKVNI